MFCCLLKCFESFFDKQSRPRSGSTLFASILKIVNNVMYLFAQMTFSDACFVGVLKRVCVCV